MRFDLAAMMRRTRNIRRRVIVIRDIQPPAVLSTDLFRSTYAHVVALWQRTAEQVIAEYERSLSALTTDAPADLNATLDQAETEMQRLVLLLRPSLRDWSVRIERWFRGKWIGAVLTASKVDLSTFLTAGDVQQTLEATIEWNTSLIKDVGAQARQRIGTAVFNGLRNREPARDVAKVIREATGMARRRSVGIASDQLSKLTSALATERRLQAKLSVYEWVHSRKLHPRVEHRARDGKLYSSDKAMIGREVDGKTVNEEPPADDRVGQRPWCGCRERACLIF